MKIFINKPLHRKFAELERYNDSGFPILSLYLGWEKKPPTSQELVSQVRSLMKRRLKPYEQRVFRSDRNKIIHFLQESFDQRNTQGIAFFAARDKLWKAIPLDLPVPNICIISHSPYLQPITEEKKEQSRYAIILFDREKAKLLLVEAGKIKQLSFFESHRVPQRSKTKKEWIGRDDKESRRTENRLREHFGMIVKRFKRFLGTNSFTKLILGGHQETFREFENILGKGIRSKVVARVPVDLKRNLDQIIDRCLGAV